MSTRESLDLVIRSVDDAIFSADNGKPLNENSLIDISTNVQATITEKLMPLSGELYFFIGVGVTFAVEIGKDVLTGLISDWIKYLIQIWKDRKKPAETDKPIVILLLDSKRIEFRIVKNEVRITIIDK
jgi:hypothetical protein